jgi:outer membrane protein TolC
MRNRGRQLLNQAEGRRQVGYRHTGLLPSPWKRTLCLFGWIAAILCCPHCMAEPVLDPVAETPPAILSLDAAVVWGLQHNPDLAVLRQQHGIAAAAVVIADTFPYNPTYYNRQLYAHGSVGDVTQQAPTQMGIFFQLELCGQGKYRSEAAAIALSRTDWEIAYQELTLAVRVVRAFQTAIYRNEKLQVVEETVKLNQEVFEQVRKLVELGKLRSTDLIVARTEVDATRAQLGPVRTALALAMAELYRSLGITGCPLSLKGTLEGPVSVADCKTLSGQALQLRADLRARQLAVAEAEARLRLQVADRFGNPTIGPFYENDQTSVNYYGVQMNIPIPVFNRKQGEIQQREADKVRAALDVHRTEVQIVQDVEAAIARLGSARESASIYQKEVMPNLRTGLESFQKLFQQGEPGADLLRQIDLQRKLLQARSGYLDALWEVAQAQADLAAAVGDPVMAVGPCQPIQKIATDEPIQK